MRVWDILGYRERSASQQPVGMPQAPSSGRLHPPTPTSAALDGRSCGDGVCQSARVGGGDRYEMLLPAFVVQLGLGAQLTGGLDDLEFVGGGNAVGEPVVVAVGGGHGRAEVLPPGRFSRMLRS